MNNLEKMAAERIRQLEKMLDEKRLKEFSDIDGSLRIDNGRGKARYYHVRQSGDTNGEYLGKENRNKIHALAQKSYNEAVIAAAEKELKYLKRFSEKYPGMRAEDIYGMLHPERKKLIEPVCMPDDIFIKEWLDQTYVRKEFRSDDETCYYTDSGIRVRSKSEIILFNTIERFDVPYLIERPTFLEGFGRVYPDGVLLDIRTRKEVIWEHYGLIDDRDYRDNSFMKKQEAYIANGFYPGENLIQTFETQRHPLSVHMIEQIIRHYFFE